MHDDMSRTGPYRAISHDVYCLSCCFIHQTKTLPINSTFPIL
jgi:hypothetical protein